MPHANGGDRIGGISLAAGTVVALALVAHHPVAQAGPELFDDINRLRQIDHLVHGGLIALLLVFTFGFIGLAARLGLDRPLVRAGLLAYATGCIVTIGAALVDGFIIPDLARHFGASPPDEAKIAHDLLVLCGLSIQTLTKAGLVLISAGILAWSTALLMSRGAERVVGGVGLVAGGLPAIVILATGLVLQPPVLLAIMAVQCLWNLAVAWLLMRDRG